MTLVYNLVRKDTRQPLTLPAYEKEQTDITALLRHWVTNKNSPGDNSPEKLIYPLEHAYTTAELAFDTLKNADAAAAAVLVRAAEEAACDLHLALVSIDESGSAEYTDYAPRGLSRWHRARYDEEEENFEIGEIIDRTLTVSDWRLPDGSHPAMNALPFSENELCPPDLFEGMEPDEQHFHEATGNEGASFERTYRRAAFVLWPRTHKLAVINQAGLQVTLPYLMDLAERWTQCGEDKESSTWGDAHTLSGYMLRDWPASSGYLGTRQADNVIDMLSSLTQLRDTVRIDAFLADISARGIYHESENEVLVRAASLLLPDRAAELIEQVIARNAHVIPVACAGLLAHICADATFADSTALLLPAATTLVETLLGERVNPSQPDPWQRPAPIEPGLIDHLLTALSLIGAASLADRVVDHVLASPKSFGMDAIVVPAVLGLTERAQTENIASVRRLRAACLTHLRSRWVRQAARKRRTDECAYCSELGRFLADPGRKEYAFKAAEEFRRHVETSIRHNGCDLDFVTSTVGRPYSLICKKNQASYERRVRQRKNDLRALERLNAHPAHG